MRYIDYKKILSPDELQALGGVMARLKNEAKSVRVSKLGDANGSERMDLTPMLMSGMTYPEVFALIRCLYNRVAGQEGPVDLLWKLLLNGADDYDIRDRLSLWLGFEAFCRDLYRVMTGKENSKIVMKDMFDFKVGKKATLFPSRTSRLGRFFVVLKEMRNINGHGNPLPKDAGHMVCLGLLILFRLHGNALKDILIPEDGMMEIDAGDVASGMLSDTGKKMESVAGKMAGEAKDRIARLFGIFDSSEGNDFVLALSRIHGKLTYEAGLTVIEGKRGSGVSTALLRQIVERKPCRYMIMADELALTKSVFDIDWLVAAMIGTDRLNLIPVELEACRQWVLAAAARGEIAVVIDTGSVIPDGFDRRVRSLLDKVPGLMVLVGTESGDVPAEKIFADCEPRVRQMPPMSEKQLKSLTGVVGRKIKPGFDLSGILSERIEILRTQADLTHPLTIVKALGDLSSGLSETFIDYTGLSDRLRQLGGACNGYRILENEKRAIKRMADDAYQAVYGASSVESAFGIIEKSGWLENLTKAQRFFELCHILDEDDKVALLATLAAKKVLSDSDGENPEWQDYNPSLPLLAAMTKSLPVDSPMARNGHAVYRPSPRYIVERYVVNMLRRLDAGNAWKLVKAALYVGSGPVIDLLTSPDRIALLQDDKFVSANIRPINPVKIALAVVDWQQRLSMLADSDHKKFYSSYLSLLSRMNDAQRIELCECLQRTFPARSLTFMPTAAAANLALMSMDIPGGESVYDMSTRIPSLPHDFINRFIDNAGAESSWPLLMKVTLHAAQQGYARLLNESLSALVDIGAYQSAEFTELVNNLLDNKNKSVVSMVVQILDKMPLEKLEKDAATRIYNPTLTEITSSWLVTASSVRTRLWEIDGTTAPMLAPALPEDYVVNDMFMYPFRLYGFGENCVEFGVEPFDCEAKSPVGRFVDIDGYGMIGSVTGIRRIIPPGPGSLYAHLTVELSEIRTLEAAPSPMWLTIGRGGFAKGIPYIAKFERKGTNIAIVRINDTETIEALREESVLTDLSVKINGIISKVLEVEIVRISQPMTVMEVTPCPGARRGGMPSEGNFSLHYTPYRNSRNYSKKVRQELSESPGRVKQLYTKDYISAGVADGDLLLVLPGGELVPKGTILQYGNLPLKVMARYIISKTPTIPEVIRVHLDSAIAVIKERGHELAPQPTVLRLKVPEGSESALPAELTEAGTKIETRIIQTWSTGLFSPVTRLWDKSACRDGAYECAWVPLRAAVDDSGDVVARIPYHPMWKQARHMRLLEVPFTFKASFRGNNLIPDPMIKSLLRSRAGGDRRSEPFYVMLLDADRNPIRPMWKNVGDLIEGLGEWGHIAPETAAMIAEFGDSIPDVIDKARYAIAQDVEHVGHEKWLRRNIESRFLTQKLCRLLPLAVSGDESGNVYIRWRSAQGEIRPISKETVDKLKRIMKI